VSDFPRVRSMAIRLGVVAALLGLLGACGVPGQTKVVVDGQGKASGVLSNGGSEELRPPGPGGAATPEVFVDRYLQAAAGDWDGAQARVKEFLAPDATKDWQNNPRQIVVVRLTDGKPDISLSADEVRAVTLHVQQLGVLTSQGLIEQPTSQTQTYQFQVGTIRASGGRLAILDPPPVMLLTDTALKNWYDERPIYFWDTARQNLVPDLRYMPRAVESSARPSMVLGWLLGGAVNWLRPSVQQLPEGTDKRGNPFTDAGRLVVNLSAAVENQNLDQLVTQLQWSLRPDYTGDLVLQVEGQTKRIATDKNNFLDRNPAYRLAKLLPQELYCVANGIVRRAPFGVEQVPATVGPLTAEVNKDVQSAAISREHDRVALVRAEAGNWSRLWVGPLGNQFIRTSLRARVMSRPAWAENESVGYVAADGLVRQFSVDSEKFVTVPIGNMANNVTALAVSPDGERLAVIADGKLYLVALGRDGDISSVGSARPVPTPLTNLTSVAWLGQTALVMTGLSGNRAALAKTTMDGAVERDTVQQVAASNVTQVVALPEDPLTSTGSQILIQADGRAYWVFSDTIEELAGSTLAGAAPNKPPVPTAPFFLD
jgi:hypothetical protein